MEVVAITLREYRAFMKEIYENDPDFKDNKSGLLDIVCDKEGPFFQLSRQEIVAVKQDGTIICACILIIHQNCPEMLEVAFFEARPDCHDAAMMLLDHAVNVGKVNDCKKLVVALDGHLNNGIGFGTGPEVPSFGESYSPAYYHQYFRGYKPTKLVSFQGDFVLAKKQITKDIIKFERARSKIEIEMADFNFHFDETMRRYTDLNNEIFGNHRYYFPREYAEDRQLFKAMVPLLKNRNLIFAKCDGKDIGFVLWYPDLNELVAPGKGCDFGTFIKYRILFQQPATVKVVEIGGGERTSKECGDSGTFQCCNARI